MRGYMTGFMSIALLLAVGCDEPQTSRRESGTAPGGAAMRPLTSPQPAPPMQGYPAPAVPAADPAVAARPSPYAGLGMATPAAIAPAPAPVAATPTPGAPAYSGAEIYTTPDFTAFSPAYSSSSGQYCEVTDTTESSYLVPMQDPPILVDGRTTAYYPPQAQSPAPMPSPSPAPMYAPAPVYAPTPAIVTPVLPAPVQEPFQSSAVSFQPPAAGQLQLVPATDIPPGNHPNDYGPSQWFEIVRPGNGPIRIGRVSSTCVCVGARVPNRHVEAGQRALVEARLVSRPSQSPVTYGLYVQVLEPENVMLDADVTVSARR